MTWLQFCLYIYFSKDTRMQDLFMSKHYKLAQVLEKRSFLWHNKPLNKFHGVRKSIEPMVNILTKQFSELLKGQG